MLPRRAFQILLAAFYYSFCHCVHDVYGIENPIVRDIWLSAVFEARSVMQVASFSPATAVFFMLPAILGLMGAIVCFFKSQDDRVLWGSIIIVMSLASALTLYQIRTGDILLALSTAPLAIFFMHMFSFCRSILAKVNMGLF